MAAAAPAATRRATISEAWRRIPAGQPLQGTGYRINLTAGDYPESVYPQYWEDRHGTYDFPILLASADGPGAARLWATWGSRLPMWTISICWAASGDEADVFHCEQCRHLLIRDSVFDGGNRQAHETIKINQSQHVYIENSDIGGSYENAIDFVAVQHGHILNNRIHDADDWCIYLKGGSAYFTLAGNEIDHCGTGGFTAGQGTGFEFMAQPWLHCDEAYACSSSSTT